MMEDYLCDPKLWIKIFSLPDKAAIRFLEETRNEAVESGLTDDSVNLYRSLVFISLLDDCEEPMFAAMTAKADDLRNRNCPLGDYQVFGRKWIPVSTRVPPSNTTVLFHNEAGVSVGQLTPVGWYDLIVSCHTSAATHWMEMPEPPEDEDANELD